MYFATLWHTVAKDFEMHFMSAVFIADIGMSFDSGIFISNIVPGGVAAKEGLSVGDRIINVSNYLLSTSLD